MIGLTSEAVFWLVISCAALVYGVLHLLSYKSENTEPKPGLLEPYLLPKVEGELSKPEERKAIGVIFVTIAAASFATAVLFNFITKTMGVVHMRYIASPILIKLITLSVTCSWFCVFYLLRRHGLRTGKAYPRFVRGVVHRAQDLILFQRGLMIYNLLTLLMGVMAILMLLSCSNSFIDA